MAQVKQIEIPLSRKKMLLTFLGAIAFVAIGLLFLISPPKTSIPITLIFIVGAASILFFGFVAVTVLRKYLNQRAGLIINRLGIMNNSNGVPPDVLLWSDIEDIKISNVAGQRFLVFMVRNPKDYFENATNPIKKNIMEMNYEIYGSPICISANSLQINFDKLYSLLTDKMKE
jgi:hypothetical protein